MKLIGLTGLYCAGKNYIADILEKKGVPVLDVDKLGHTAIEFEKEAIAARFGEDIFKKEKREIDRKVLGEKVFGKPSALADLEAIVHPAANRLVEEWVAGQSGGICVINAALIHKVSVFDRFDAVIIVKAPFFLRFIRALKRDRLPFLQIVKRFHSQKDFLSQYLAKNADKEEKGKVSVYFVNNTGVNTKRRIDGLLSSIIKLS